MIRLFDKDSKIIKYISDGALLTVHQNQRLTDEGYISEQLTVQMNILDDDIFNGAEYMTIPAKGHDTLHHLFWIKDKYSDNRFTNFTGVLEGIEELSKTPVIDVRPQNATLRSAVEQVLDGTNYIARYVADTGRRSSNAYFTDIWSALKRYASVWRVEMQLFVEVTETGIGARYIDFRQQVGVNNGARVVYGHNALEILKEEERSEIYTALIGRGNGEEVGESTEGDATFGRKINFKDVEWKKSDGDPLDKPLGQYYLELPEATERYGIKYGNSMKPKIGFVDVDTDDQEEVLELTHEALMQVSRPKVMFRASAVYLKGDIGDTVRVVRKDRGIDYDTRIFDITHDRLENSILDIKLGDNMLETQAARERRIAGNAAVRVEEQINNNLTEHVQYIVSANGLNRNYYTTIDPRDEGFKPMLNDIWYRPDPDSEGDTILYIWNGSVWEEVTRTFNNSKVAGLIKDVQDLKEAVAEDVEITIENIIDVLDGASEVNLAHIFARLIGDDRFSTLFYQEAENIGFVYREGDEVKSIIAIQQGVPFIRGEHIILDGNTIVDGDFTVTEQMLADSAVFDKLETHGIDAAEIRVINLDASNISGGNLELANGLKITNNGAVVMEVTSDGKFRFDATAAGVATKQELENTFEKNNLIPNTNFADMSNNTIPRDWIVWQGAPYENAGIRYNGEMLLIRTPTDNTTLTRSLAVRTPQLVEDVIEGQQYTLSVWAESFMTNNHFKLNYCYLENMNGTNQGLLNPMPMETKVLGNGNVTFTRYERTFTANFSGPARMIIGNTLDTATYRYIYLHEPILQKGSEYKGYSISIPADLKTYTEHSVGGAVQGLVTTHINDIRVDLTNYQSVLESKQDASEYLTKMNEIDDALEKEQDAMNAARTDISTLLGRTSSFEQTLGEHSITKKFVDTFMTEADEGLFIHNEAGTQGIRISKDRIDFVSESDEEIFYISGQNFYIKSGIIVNSFRVGAHEEVRLNNNSTVTRWVGG